MAKSSTDLKKSRTSEKAEQVKSEQRPDAPTTPLIPVELQQHVMRGAPGEARLNVRLHIDGSDADGVRCFDETLPVSIVRAILAPNVADFFIPVQATARMKPPRAKGHFLHTSYIREITLLDELPEEGE